MVLGIDERIDGVNLGNWLVLEKWMDPKPFTRSAEDDEICNTSIKNNGNIGRRRKTSNRKLGK